MCDNPISTRDALLHAARLTARSGENPLSAGVLLAAIRNAGFPGGQLVGALDTDLLCRSASGPCDGDLLDALSDGPYIDTYRLTRALIDRAASSPAE